MFVALCVFGYASYELTLIYIESKDSLDLKKDVADMFMQDVPAEVETQLDENGEVVTIDNTTTSKKFVWDYDKLLAYNSEAKGYIRQDDGEYIDNPILQHSDNDYYLYHMPNHVYSTVGSIFIDYRIQEGLEAKNCIIYGHMMSYRVECIMFGSLRWYFSDRSYGLSHPTMDIYSGYDHYKYYVFAAYKTEAVGGDAYQYSFSSDESFMNYVNKAKEKSIYEFPEAGEILPTDKIITLSTCTPENDKSKRLIIHLVRREKVDDDGNIIEEETTEAETTTVAAAEEVKPQVQPSTQQQTQQPQPETTTVAKETVPETTTVAEQISSEEETTENIENTEEQTTPLEDNSEE